MPELTEEQVKTANEAEMARWEDDFKKEDLTVPFSREDIKEEPKETEEESSEELEAPDDIDYTEPEPVIKTEDPGEFKPSDYSFTVETLDGAKTKITTPEQAEEFAESNADNLSVAQQIKLVRMATKMEVSESKEREKWESQKSQFDNESKINDERQENIQSLANEIQYMITKGLIPDVADEYKDADWSNPDVAKQPGVKEQIELVNYMTKENNARIKAGVKPFSSVTEAFNSMSLEKGKNERQESRERSNEARKSVASKVSSPSASSESVKAPKGIAVGNPNIFKRNSSIWE